MNIITNSRLLILIVLSLFIMVRYAAAQQNADLAPLGFTFGISDDDAEDLIETNGKRIMENSVDSIDVDRRCCSASRTFRRPGALMRGDRGLAFFLLCRPRQRETEPLTGVPVTGIERDGPTE